MQEHLPEPRMPSRRIILRIIAESTRAATATSSCVASWPPNLISEAGSCSRALSPSPGWKSPVWSNCGLSPRGLCRRRRPSPCRAVRRARVPDSPGHGPAPRLLLPRCPPVPADRRPAARQSQPPSRDTAKQRMGHPQGMPSRNTRHARRRTLTAQLRAPHPSATVTRPSR